MDCPWKFYIDIEEFFSADINQYTFFFTVDHVIANLNTTEINLIKDITEEKYLIDSTEENHLIGHEIQNVLGIDSVFSNEITAQQTMVLRQRKPLHFHDSIIIKNKYQADLLTIKIPIYSKPKKLEGIFGIGTYLWKFSIENAIQKGLTKREIECLFLFLKKCSTKKIAKLLNLQIRTIEAYFEEIKAKLKCYNRSNIIEEAFKAKIIDDQNLSSSCDLFSNSYHSLFKNSILTKVF